MLISPRVHPDDRRNDRGHGQRCACAPAKSASRYRYRIRGVTGRQVHHTNSCSRADAPRMAIRGCSACRGTSPRKSKRPIACNSRRKSCVRWRNDWSARRCPAPKATGKRTCDTAGACGSRRAITRCWVTRMASSKPPRPRSNRWFIRRTSVAAANRCYEHVEQDEPFDVALRLRMKSGEYRWFRHRGMAERDADGNTLLIAGSIQDAHEQKLAEDALRLTQQRLERAINGTQDGLWEMDADGSSWHSPRVAELLGYEDFGAAQQRELPQTMPASRRCRRGRQRDAPAFPAASAVRRRDSSAHPMGRISLVSRPRDRRARYRRAGRCACRARCRT